jgi:hypothetical protein
MLNQEMATTFLDLEKHTWLGFQFTTVFSQSRELVLQRFALKLDSIETIAHTVNGLDQIFISSCGF